MPSSGMWSPFIFSLISVQHARRGWLEQIADDPFLPVKYFMDEIPAHPQRIFCMAVSNPAAIDNEFLRSAHGAIVRCQEQHHSGNMPRQYAAGQALALIAQAFAGFNQPSPDQPLSHRPTWRHCEAAE